MRKSTSVVETVTLKQGMFRAEVERGMVRITTDGPQASGVLQGNISLTAALDLLDILNAALGREA